MRGRFLIILVLGLALAGCATSRNDLPVAFSSETLAASKEVLLEKVYRNHSTPEMIAILVSGRVIYQKPEYMKVLKELYPDVKPTPVKAFWGLLIDEFIQRWRSDYKEPMDKIFLEEMTDEDLRIFSDISYRDYAKNSLKAVQGKSSSDFIKIDDAARRYDRSLKRTGSELAGSVFQNARERVLADPQILISTGLRVK